MDWARVLFLGFAAWPGFDTTQPDVVPELRRIAGQVSELEQRFETPQAITQESLLEAFGVDGLRRRQLLMGYLRAGCGVVWSEAVSQAFTEKRRIVAILQEASSNGLAGHLEGFDAWLSTSLALRSRRAYLRAALEFLRAQKNRDVGDIDQARVTAFVRMKPGQRASLTPFLRYLRETRGCDLAATRRRRPRTQRGQDRLLVRRVRDLRAALRAAPSWHSGRACLIALLSSLYQMPLEAIAQIESHGFRLIQGRWWLCGPQGDFRLTPEVAGFLETYAALHAKGPAFPGRPPSSPIHTASVHYHLRKCGIVSG